MDSLLFAMFAVSSPLDASVLERQQASGSVAARLQQSVRERFVDRIRDPRGAVSEEDVTAIRKLVIELSTQHKQQHPPKISFLETQDEHEQQDVSEFFRFIIDALASDDVKLLVQRNTHHEGLEEDADQRDEVLSDLILALGDLPAQHLKWDQLLDDFMTGQVDVRRRVEQSRDKGVSAFNW